MLLHCARILRFTWA